MAAPDLSQYVGEAGTKVLHYEYQLRELGLALEKSRLGKLYPPGASGGILDVYDFLQFKKRDEKFSEPLVEFLRDKIGLSAERITRLEQQAVLSPEDF
jgi:hypothetical protein